MFTAVALLLCTQAPDLDGLTKDTWRSITLMAEHGPLPGDGLTGKTVSKHTSPSNVAAYLWSVLAAEKLRLISESEADRRLRETIEAVGKLPRHRGVYYNWYDADGRTLKSWPDGTECRPFASSIDNAWLACAFDLVLQSRPSMRLPAYPDLSLFYDRESKFATGGVWADTGEPAGFHYRTWLSETRIISYVAVRHGQFPAEHMKVFERNGKTWGGSLFEAYAVPLFVEESHQPTAVLSAHKSRGKPWGAAPAVGPDGVYREYGVPLLALRPYREGDGRGRVVAPYASLLALPWDREAVLENVTALRSVGAYGPMGFYDSVNCDTGGRPDSVLLWDQALIMRALAVAAGAHRLKVD